MNVLTRFRVLLSCIKYLGNFPCPRCLVEKCKIHELGTKFDIRHRDKFCRIDNEHRVQAVATARKWIFTKGVRVGAKSIGDLIKSLTPTQVTRI
jgi:hypothetical protein